jgi:hypothetical protein
MLHAGAEGFTGDNCKILAFDSQCNEGGFMLSLSMLILDNAPLLQAAQGAFNAAAGNTAIVHELSNINQLPTVIGSALCEVEQYKAFGFSQCSVRAVNEL